MASKNYTPRDVKEMLVQLAYLKDLNGCLIRDLNATSLADMASFDPAGIDSINIGSPVFQGPDLVCGLLTDLNDYNTEIWLLNTVNKIVEDEETRTEVIGSLDEDLKSAGNESLLGPNVSLTSKVQFIASHRCKRILKRIEGQQAPIQAQSRPALQPSSSSSRPFDVDFFLQFSRLVNGRGDSIRQTKLYLQFCYSFSFFLDIFENELQFCLIPPPEIVLRDDFPSSCSPIRSFHLKADSTPNPSTTTTDGESTESTREPSWTNSPISISSFSSVSSFRPQSELTREYTSRILPWSYIIREGEGPDSFLPLRDGDDYDQMIQRLKAIKAKTPGTELTVEFMRVHV